MFRVKICGITRPEDAELCRVAGADAIGLNFFPRSPRCVTVERARGIAAVAGGGLLKVGVFVNADAAQILRTVAAVPLDVIQLHGDEAPEFLEQLSLPRVIKAFREADPAWKSVRQYLETCTSHGNAVDAILVDAQQAGQFGGTGKTVNWAAVGSLVGKSNVPDVILAGGLRVDNIEGAVGMARPFGVDTASGVESSPGIKDAALVNEFVRRARLALSKLAMGGERSCPFG